MAEMGVSDLRNVAAEEIYFEHAGELVRFATVLVGPDDGNDVVSAAVLRVLGRGFDGIDNPRAYLFRAVANEARNLRRSDDRRRTRELQAPVNAVSYPTDAYPEVRAAVMNLSVRQRAVVYLIYWADLPEHAVADHLGISAGSVRRHLARARTHLRRALHED